MNDDLGDRQKVYESRSRQFLPKRTYSLMRLDGRAFHTLTKSMDKPFDADFIEAMNATAIKVAKEVSGVCFGYVQSDEISLVIQDFKTHNTEAWFGGNIQKMVSVSAAIAAVTFSKSLENRINLSPPFQEVSAQFDSRVWSIADPDEVINYFVWRQQDCSRNSVQMVARSLYSHKELIGKNNSQLQDLIYDKGQNWNDYPTGQRRGRCIVKEPGVVWTIADEIPIFTQHRGYLKDQLLTYEEAE